MKIRESHMPRKSKMRGASLVELLIGLTLGLFIMLAVFGAVRVASNTNHTNDSLGQTQEAVRFGAAQIGADIMATGYWGLTADARLITGRQGDTTQLSQHITGDCLGDSSGWSIGLATALEIYNDTNAPFGSSCVPNATYRAGTDVIAVRYASACAIPSTQMPCSSYPVAGQLLIRSQRTGGALYAYKDAASAPALGAGAEDRALVVRLYWIGNGSDGEPALHVTSLTTSGTQLQDSVLVPEVEDLQAQVGVDTDGDGSINQFINADQLTPWNSRQVLAVRLMLLVKDPHNISPFNVKTFSYAGKSYTPTDKQYRFLYTTTLMRRNAG